MTKLLLSVMKLNRRCSLNSISCDFFDIEYIKKANKPQAGPILEEKCVRLSDAAASNVKKRNFLKNFHFP